MTVMILMKGLTANLDTLTMMTQGTTRSGVLGMTLMKTRDITGNRGRMLMRIQGIAELGMLGLTSMKVMGVMFYGVGSGRSGLGLNIRQVNVAAVDSAKVSGDDHFIGMPGLPSTRGYGTIFPVLDIRNLTGPTSPCW